MPSYQDVPIGTIPQVPHTFKYFNTAYPCLNEHQLAIGESTIGGRATLKSDSGLIECQTLCMLLMQRCSTARDAIRTADTLTKKYGEPTSFSPQAATWKNDEVTMSLEKPLTLKYIDNKLFDQTQNYSNIQASPTEVTRDMFLDGL